MIDVLKRCQQLFKEALPKFNWGASALDAHAIQLLNEVPAEVQQLVELLGRPIGYVRLVRKGGLHSQDFKPNRLNIHVDNMDRIEKVSFG